MSRRQPKGDVIYIIWCVLRNAHVCVFLHMSHVCVCKYVLVSLCVSVSLPMCLCTLSSGMVCTTSDMEWCVPPLIWYGVYHIGKLTLPLYLFQAKHTQTGFKTSLSFSRWARFFDSNVIKSRRLVCPISLDSSCHQGPQGHQKTTVNRPSSWEGPWRRLKWPIPQSPQHDLSSLLFHLLRKVFKTDSCFLMVCLEWVIVVWLSNLLGYKMSQRIFTTPQTQSSSSHGSILLSHESGDFSKTVLQEFISSWKLKWSKGQICTQRPPSSPCLTCPPCLSYQINTPHSLCPPYPSCPPWVKSPTTMSNSAMSTMSTHPKSVERVCEDASCCSLLTPPPSPSPPLECPCQWP